jgi:two-component system, cell cycle response regulator
MASFRILLVEDEKLQAKATKEYLENAGYEIVWVENGASAIKAAKTEAFDVIVLDLVLPDIGGNTVCKYLKQDKGTQNIPIIILSARGSTKERVLGLETGAADYLSKPYDPSELKARIYASLRTKVLQDELKEKNRQLEEVLLQMETLAMTDQLTGLVNRRAFSSVIEKELSRSVRYNHPTSCLMIDIDHFKSINDVHGHNAGDQVLKEISQVMLNCLRKADTVARWGGEEFIVLLPATAKKDALIIASRVLTAVSKCKFSSLPGQVTVSIGLAGIPEQDIDTTDKLIAVADGALYKAKANGRNRIEIA